MKTSITNEIKSACDLLKAGEIVAVPTETVYGLAANGLNPLAIQKIFEAKSRPKTNPLILHFANENDISPYVLNFPEQLKALTKVFWPGPLTILLPKSDIVNDGITGGREQVAVRVPAHPLFQQLLQQVEFPLAAPSANLYGSLSPTSAAHVYKQLAGKIPLILDGGPCEKGIESTIVGLEDDQLIIYRLGSISVEELAFHLGKIPQIKNESTNQVIASGMVKHHYAPKTPLYFYNSTDTGDQSDAAYIYFKEIPENNNTSNSIVLSKSGNLNEAARNLYSTLHHFDERGFKKIFIENFPPHGLGASLNDRIERATAKFIP